MSDFACKECHLILDEKSCPRCPDSEISREWQGFVEILNPERSEIAKLKFPHQKILLFLPLS